MRLHHHSIDITLCTASASIFISRQHQNSSLSPPFSFDTYNRISGQCLSPCGPSPAGSCGGERGGVRACVRACVCVPWSWASSYECGGHPKQLATAFGDSEVGRRREGARDVSSHIRCAVIATTPTRIDLDRSCALHVNQRHLLRRSRTASQTPHSRKHTRTHAHTLSHTPTYTLGHRASPARTIFRGCPFAQATPLTLPLATVPERKHQLAKMGYEDSVYLAKLAEQAERYEGESPVPLQSIPHSLTLRQKWSRT